ncbi:MAG TPA: hypothetical protein VMT34_01815 [Aggregatilineales bacterium]|nr:hypothetical protein [Aggregatilineales bacterium]
MDDHSPFDAYLNPAFYQGTYHWCQRTQPIAPAHILLQYIAHHWLPASLVTAQSFRLSEHRHVEVYEFVLYNGLDTITVPVLANPIVRRVIHQFKLTVENRSAAYTAYDMDGELRL